MNASTTPGLNAAAPTPLIAVEDDHRSCHPESVPLSHVRCQRPYNPAIDEAVARSDTCEGPSDTTAGSALKRQPKGGPPMPPKCWAVSPAGSHQACCMFWLPSRLNTSTCPKLCDAAPGPPRSVELVPMVPTSIHEEWLIDVEAWMYSRYK